MADVKPEVLVPEIADGIYVKLQRNPHIFWSNNMLLVLSGVRLSDKSKMVACNRKWLRTNVCSACIHDSNEIPTAIPMFSRSSNVTGLVRILSYMSG